MAIRATLAINAALTTAPQSIYSLLAAVDPNAARNVRLYRVTGDAGNTDDVIHGDANVSTSRYDSLVRAATDSIQQNAENHNSISLTNKYLRARSGTQTAHIYYDTF